MMKNFPFKTAKSAIVAAVAVCLSLVNARTAFGQVEFLSIDDARQSIKPRLLPWTRTKQSMRSCTTSLIRTAKIAVTSKIGCWFVPIYL
jgi:hypothetical protein